MLQKRKILTLILLQAFLAFGGLFGAKAYCIEEDGDVFNVNLLTGADEADNDQFEADSLKTDDQKALNSAENEKYIIVFVSDDSRTPTINLDFPPKLFVVLTIPPFTLIEQSGLEITQEVPLNNLRLPNLHIPAIRSIVINC